MTITNAIILVAGCTGFVYWLAWLLRAASREE
jgi:hypothetical protein